MTTKPNVLFKVAGEAWGNDDNLWLRENGMGSKLFLDQGVMNNFTAIFMAGKQPWIITRGGNVFKNTLTHRRYISEGLNILSARSEIIGHPEWSTEQIFSFLIEQITMMPTIDIVTLARDVFVDGEKFAQGVLGKIVNSGACGTPCPIPLTKLNTIQSSGRLRDDGLPDPQTEVYQIVIGNKPLDFSERLDKTLTEKPPLSPYSIMRGRIMGKHDIKEFRSQLLGDSRKVDWANLEDIEPAKFPPNPNPEEFYSTSELCEFTGPSEKVFTPADLFIGIETSRGKTTSMQIMKSRVDSLRRRAGILDSLPVSFFASRTREECEEILNGTIVDYPNILGVHAEQSARDLSKLFARLREGIRTGFEQHLTDTKGPHHLVPGYNGQKVMGFDPGTGESSVVMVKENIHPLSLTKEDVSLGDSKDLGHPAMNTFTESGDVPFDALKHWDKFNDSLASIRESVKDGEVRAESEQYLNDRKPKGE